MSNTPNIIDATAVFGHKQEVNKLIHDIGPLTLYAVQVISTIEVEEGRVIASYATLPLTKVVALIQDYHGTTDHSITFAKLVQDETEGEFVLSLLPPTNPGIELVIHREQEQEL